MAQTAFPTPSSHQCLYGEEDILYGTLSYYLGEQVDVICHSTLDCQGFEYDETSDLWHRTGQLNLKLEYFGTVHVVQASGKRFFVILLNQKQVHNIIHDVGLFGDVKITNKFVTFSNTLTHKLHAFEVKDYIERELLYEVLQNAKQEYSNATPPLPVRKQRHSFKKRSQSTGCRAKSPRKERRTHSAKRTGYNSSPSPTPHFISAGTGETVFPSLHSFTPPLRKEPPLFSFEPIMPQNSSPYFASSKPENIVVEQFCLRGEKTSTKRQKKMKARMERVKQEIMALAKNPHEAKTLVEKLQFKI